jgi:drug/metabolite transporter (DMT)-like permease
MTAVAFGLILLSIFLHVGWNLISKKSQPSAAFYLLSSVTSFCIYFPCVFFAGIDWSALDSRFWCFLFCSIFFEILYFIGLFKTYRSTDISLAYPMVRALPVLLVAAVTTLFSIGKPLNGSAFLGLFIVFAGCLLMPLKSFSQFSLRNYMTPALGAMLLAACGTTGYTVFDGMLIPRLLDHAAGAKLAVTGTFIAMLELGITTGLSIYVLSKKEERAEFKKLAGRSWMPHFCGIGSSSAYILVVLAMPLVTNLSYVQAFRQMSLPLGVAAGIFLLKEKCPPVRLAGVAAVAAGLVIMALK